MRHHAVRDIYPLSKQKEFSSEYLHVANVGVKMKVHPACVSALIKRYNSKDKILSNVGYSFNLYPGYSYSSWSCHHISTP